MSSLIRLYPACYTGEIQALNTVQVCLHKLTVQKVDGSAGKMVEDNHAHPTQIYTYLYKLKYFPSFQCGKIDL